MTDLTDILRDALGCAPGARGCLVHGHTWPCDHLADTEADVRAWHEAVTWEARGSCGCPFGWTVAESRGEVYAATPEQAKAELLGENAVRRAYYEASGATIHAIHRTQIPRGDRCEHTPRWGLPDADPPEGHEWATTDGTWGRKTHKRHIVPLLPTGDGRDDLSARCNAVALCGKKATGRESYAWNSDRTDRFAHVQGKVPCSNCIKAVTA